MNVNCELSCHIRQHWPKHAPALEYVEVYLLDLLHDFDAIPEFRTSVPIVYLISLVDLDNPQMPTLYKYVGSTQNIGRRMKQHLSAIWTGNSRYNGCLLLTSVGHAMLQRFKDDLSFFRLKILKQECLTSDLAHLHVEEKASMLAEKSFALYGLGGLNVVDPVSNLYVLSGGVRLSHLQSLPFHEEWTCADFVNQVILPRTSELCVSYHTLLHQLQQRGVSDHYRLVPDFYVAPTCNGCKWKTVLQYIHRNATTQKPVKQNDARALYLYEAGELFVHLSFLAINLHHETRGWPFPL